MLKSEWDLIITDDAERDVHTLLEDDSLWVDDDEKIPASS